VRTVAIVKDGSPVILKDKRPAVSPLHCECHLNQAIASPSAVPWLDFEAAGLGPKEWDLAALDEEGVSAYGTADPSLLTFLRTARLFCIVTWCWTQPDRAPEVREAGRIPPGIFKEIHQLAARKVSPPSGD